MDKQRGGGGREQRRLCNIPKSYWKPEKKKTCPPLFTIFLHFLWSRNGSSKARDFSISSLSPPPCIIPLSLPFVCSPEVEKQSGFINSVCLKLCYKKNKKTAQCNCKNTSGCLLHFFPPALSKQLVFYEWSCSSLCSLRKTAEWIST